MLAFASDNTFYVLYLLFIFILYIYFLHHRQTMQSLSCLAGNLSMYLVVDLSEIVPSDGSDDFVAYNTQVNSEKKKLKKYL